jgi:hypothetical protein
MGRNRWIAWLTLALGAGLPAQSAVAEIVERSTVRVVLTDVAGLSAPALERAKNEAARLFERSQIDLVWIDIDACEERCLFLRITALPIGGKSRNPSVMGTAPGTLEVRGRYAWVFYDRIRAASATFRVDASQILGHVIAHELGHLLLPHGAHSLAGVMRPEWDRGQVKSAEAGLLTFTPDQAALIRERLQASASPIARVQ